MPNATIRTVGGACQLNVDRSADTQNQSGLRCRCYGLPFRHRLIAEYPECATGDEVALDVEQIVDRAVN